MNRSEVNALFLGPKGENTTFFKEMLAKAVDQHVGWRESFRPSDPYLTTAKERYAEGYRSTLYSTEDILTTLSSKLQQDSLPWFSPRYIGHMNADTLMVANLAYVMTMLYNPNNCAKEGSPVTTDLETEAGHDLCQLFGYPAGQSWGHITSGGTVANYEALWLARNLKATPRALATIEGTKDLVSAYTQKQLLNLPVHAILDMIAETDRRGLLHQLQQATPRGIGLKNQALGKILIPRSKHYSWMKAVDILGLGSDSLIPVDVDENYRTVVQDLKAKVAELIEQETPILMVITVVGTTEEGAVDPVHEISAFRRECEQQHGVSFYLHCDAAYGGYVRSMFLDENNEFLTEEALRQRQEQSDLIPAGVTWPKPSVYEAFKAMSDCDSITVDPHKSGYIPYAAGAIAIRDKRILKLISYEAAYVESGESDDVVLGHNIMEGSKAGATAAAVWATHRAVPLNLSGYGPVIGNGIVTADWLAHELEATKIEVNGKTIQIHLLMFPDYHMVNFAFKDVANASLEDYNTLNRKFYEHCSFMSGRTYQKNFLTSATSLTKEEYGDIPSAFAQRIGIGSGEWEKVQSVYILRAAVMTQFLRKREVFEDYWNDIRNEFKLVLESIA